MKQMISALTFILIFLLLCSGLYAREIRLHFPNFAGHGYDWNIFQGETQLTVSSGVIDAEGRVNLIMPEAYKDYRGMTRWMLKKGGGIDMIYAGRGFSVECLAKNPSEGNFIYTGSPENDFLAARHSHQLTLLEKLGAVYHLLQVYTSTEALHPIISKEQEALRKEFEQAQADRKKSSLYAARFGEIVDFTRGIADRMYKNPEDRTAYFNDYITQSIAFEDLYTSGHWDQVLHHWLMMNIRSEKGDAVFKDRLDTVLNRMNQDDIRTAFVRKVVPLLVQTGKDDLLPRIVTFLDTHPKAGTGLPASVQHTLASFKILTGTKAPDLVFHSPVRTQAGMVTHDITLETGKLDAANTILLFYNNSCQPCEDALITLANTYKSMKDKNVRVIAVSADETEALFEKRMAYHQWPDNYCDFSGMAGINFKNYAVLGTPTLYLLDHQGIILEKTAMAEDVLKTLETREGTRRLKLGAREPF